MKDECEECKKVDSKKQELNSRYYSLSYAKEDYDRQKGEGAFKKDFAAATKLMDDLLKEKTSLIVDHEFQHAAHEASETEEEEDREHETGVPVI
jgi:hypothetical protein